MPTFANVAEFLRHHSVEGHSEERSRSDKQERWNVVGNPEHSCDGNDYREPAYAHAISNYRSDASAPRAYKVWYNSRNGCFVYSAVTEERVSLVEAPRLPVLGYFSNAHHGRSR